MLRILRTLLALLSITMVTLLFLDFTGTAARLWPWMAKVQFIPAVLSLNILAILFVVALTFVFGRLYCSVVCPLGIFQDFVNRARIITDRLRRKHPRFRYSNARRVLRLGSLYIFLAFLLLSLVHVLTQSIPALFEPYAAWGRISTEILAPAYDGVNNALADWSESQGTYTFYRVATVISVPVLVIAILTVIIVGAFAWRGGRDYCNRICPVGTILGFISAHSLLRPVIDTEKCVGCSKCAHRCKGKCIDTHSHIIDYSRCVVCFDCINNCSVGAISYTLRKKKDDGDGSSGRRRHHHHHHHHHHHEKEEAVQSTSGISFGGDAVIPGSDNNRVDRHDGAPADSGRRAFLATAGFITGAVAAKAVNNDGGLTHLLGKVPVERLVPVVPAGAGSLDNVLRRCEGCQLCVRVCPNKVLKPTTSFYGFMQIYMDFTDGYCMPECTMCSDVCPAGVLKPIDPIIKCSTKIGAPQVDLDTCISAKLGENCGSCARHCPTGAITMVEMADGHKMPVVKQTVCIGCGSCEYHCPVGTVESTKGVSSAIHVEGFEYHYMI